MKSLRVILVAVLFLACNGKREKTDDSMSPALLVMLDFSNSSSTHLSLHKKHLEEIIAKLPSGGRLVAAKIQKTTEASFVPFIDATIPGEPGLMDVDLDVRDRQRAVQETIRKGLDSAFSNPTFSPGTNIVPALGLAKQVFPTFTRRVLVLLSDMQHVSSDLNLERAAMPDQFIDETVTKLKQTGRIPDLKGVVVYVAGATAKTDEQYRQIKKFWEKLFAESGAELKSYSRTLLNFDL